MIVKNHIRPSRIAFAILGHRETGVVMSVEDDLRAACGTGEILAVVYDGGSQPGTVREILVLEVAPPYLLAVCLATNSTKTYRLDRLAFPSRWRSYPSYVAVDLPQPPHKRFDDVLLDYCGSPLELRALIEAACAVGGSSEPLPTRVARDVREITGVMHKTYGSACSGIMGAKFSGSGNYWRSFLQDGRGNPIMLPGAKPPPLPSGRAQDTEAGWRKARRRDAPLTKRVWKWIRGDFSR